MAPRAYLHSLVFSTTSFFSFLGKRRNSSKKGKRLQKLIRAKVLRNGSFWFLTLNGFWRERRNNFSHLCLSNHSFFLLLFSSHIFFILMYFFWEAVSGCGRAVELTPLNQKIAGLNPVSRWLFIFLSILSGPSLWCNITDFPVKKLKLSCSARVKTSYIWSALAKFYLLVCGVFFSNAYLAFVCKLIFD